MSKTKIIFSLDDDTNIQEVSERLKEKGVDIEDQLPILNRIIGTADESKIEDLESVSGVKGAKKERTFKIQ